MRSHGCSFQLLSTVIGLRACGMSDGNGPASFLPSETVKRSPSRKPWWACAPVGNGLYTLSPLSHGRPVPPDLSLPSFLTFSSREGRSGGMAFFFTMTV